ncbi:hypothetical protein G647_00278 [Cladophialophora carrionii CBS 160.54]|uniref:Zn(2)-C6 fungal-type domain-containing protein n=1 Tax=Cladophialophora carrionii CBS 160.54 TaxID=1279043 RepID=V9DLN6_9EURO|nr:uncharacterized protein G647_00278 [Cladophialophora carrionii CBS 160.54]ETI27829.1 hypothetical protein G647_00278 [Cladophialophora carrionii CBS 160.54]
MASHSTGADARPSRNSDDEEASRRSRARVSRACTRCRTRKDKCDGLQPQCSNCASAGQPCIYVAATKKRGLPEGYVRGLEKLWAVMLQKVDGLDKAVRRVVDEREDELLHIWNHHKFGDELHTVWKDSSVLADLEKLLSRIDHGPQQDLKRKRDREDSEVLPALTSSPEKTLALTPDFKVTGISATTRLTEPARSGLSDQWLGQRPQTEPSATNLEPPTTVDLNLGRPPIPWLLSSDLGSERVPLPPSAPMLLDQYFTYTHCWFPILDRPYVLRKFYEHTRPKNPVQLDSGDLACLWAICAYSQQQTKHLGLQPSLGPSASVANMRARARDLIPPDSGPFAISHVQALLLLVLLDVGLGDWTSAWMLTGYAVRALLDARETHFSQQHGRMLTSAASVLAGPGNVAGAHSQSTGVKQQRWQAVLQGCFILESVVSLRLRRIPHLRRSQFNTDFVQLIDEDGHDEWEPWLVNSGDRPPSHEPAFAISCFNRLTELCAIANEATDIICYGADPGASSAQQVWNQLHALSERYCFSVAEVERRPPHQMLLQACHFIVESALLQTTHDVPQHPAPECRKILKLFDQSWNLPDKCGIPSILAAFCQLLGPSAIWGNSVETSSRLSTSWPGFRSSNAAAIDSTTARPPSLSAHTSGSVNSPLLPISPFGFQSNPTLLDSTIRNTERPVSVGYQGGTRYNNTFHLQQQTGPAASDYGRMSIDIPGQDQMDVGLEKQMAVGSGTSPSFNGDEIDALFHEMAQLDTTQWTMDRTQGLKDFGFTDDSTFQAFCNDPDRLMLSEGYMGPAFNGGSLASGGQGAAARGADAQLGGMSFEDIFR